RPLQSYGRRRVGPKSNVEGPTAGESGFVLKPQQIKTGNVRAEGQLEPPAVAVNAGRHLPPDGLPGRREGERTRRPRGPEGEQAGGGDRPRRVGRKFDPRVDDPPIGRRPNADHRPGYALDRTAP